MRVPATQPGGGRERAIIYAAREERDFAWGLLSGWVIIRNNGFFDVRNYPKMRLRRYIISALYYPSGWEALGQIPPLGRPAAHVRRGAATATPPAVDVAAPQWRAPVRRAAHWRLVPCRPPARSLALRQSTCARLVHEKLVCALKDWKTTARWETCHGGCMNVGWGRRRPEAPGTAEPNSRRKSRWLPPDAAAAMFLIPTLSSAALNCEKGCLGTKDKAQWSEGSW